MRKTLSLIVLVLIILMASSTNLYAASSTPLEGMVAGDKIIFADKEWIVLDPVVGYIILASDIGSMNWHSEYSTEYPSSIVRGHLNNSFLNSLESENKDLIMEVIWNCGKNRKENYGGGLICGEPTKKVRNKIGLLTYTEYLHYRSIIGTYSNPWWLMTGDYTSNFDGIFLIDEGTIRSEWASKYSNHVRPTLYLKSGLFVSKVTYDGNGNDEGSVPTDNNNYLRNTTAQVLDNTGALTKAGYTFGGWNTEIDGSGISYKSGDTFKMEDDSKILYAMWISE